MTPNNIILPEIPTVSKWLRLVLLSTFLLSVSFATAQAQRVLGVVWDLPADDSRAIQQLQQFQDWGITILELQRVPSERVWSEINQRNLTVYGDLNILFPSAHTFERADSSLQVQLRHKITGFATQPAVKALNLFTYGAVYQERFIKAAASFFNRFRTLQSIPTYYTGNRKSEHPDFPADVFMYDIRPTPQNVLSLSVPTSPDIDSYRYSPSNKLKKLLTPFKQVIQETSEHPQKPFFLESSWLLSMIESYPELKAILHSLATDSDPIFPAPEESLPSQSQSPLPIIILLLVWGMLAFHYNVSPLYRKSLFRYFSGHRFFLSDIFRQHIRSPFPSIIIGIQNALIISAALFTVVTNFLSDAGLQSLSHHFPGLFFFSGSEYDIFAAAFGMTLIFSLISILWLYLSHKSLRSITQIMTLFAWPLQINIVLGTLAIAIHVSDGSMMIIALLTGLMLIGCLGSFVITSMDAKKYLANKRLRYISITAGLYLLILIGLTIWLLEFNDPLWQVIDLSLQLK